MVVYDELGDEKWLREKHHEENLGLSEISDIVGCTRSAVGYAMRRNDIEIRRNTLVNEIDGSLSDAARQVIEGELLGDGCIPKQRGKAGADFTYGTASKEYRDWLANWFERQRFRVNTHEYAQDADREGRSENMTYRFGTRVYFCLRDFRERWYPNGEKIVPEDFSLTPLSLRHWYIGDGSYAPDQGVITLYTDGFDTESIERLRDELSDVAPSITISHRNGLLIRQRKHRRRFFEYIDPLPPELEDVYGYKWPDKNKKLADYA